MAGKVQIVQEVQGHAPVRYPVAVVADSRRKALARDFIAFLDGAQGRAILARHGFAGPMMRNGAAR
jgi:molybdate transport system substrate-binding protein